VTPLTPEQRRELIFRPFFIHYIGPSYPWGGCAVTDTFYGTHDWAERPRPSTDVSTVQWTQLGNRNTAQAVSR
jgi:hypothetical protein